MNAGERVEMRAELQANDEMVSSLPSLLALLATLQGGK
jgi:hypothetical protein